jgi:hypothetical protein
MPIGRLSQGIKMSKCIIMSDYFRLLLCLRDDKLI